jgi:hypothetical protein
LKSDLACLPATAAQVENQITDGQWRGKVNPVLIGGIQFLRFIRSIFRELQLDQDLEDQTAKLFIEFCKHTSHFLPDVPPEHSQIKTEMDELSASFEDDGFFTNPDVRHAMAEILARFASTPPELLKKGFAQPHWWIPYPSWSEFLKAESAAQILSQFDVFIALSNFGRRVDSTCRRR